MKLPMMMLHQQTIPPQTNKHTHTPPPMSVKLKLFSSFILSTIKTKNHLQKIIRTSLRNYSRNSYTHTNTQFSYFDSYTLLLFAPFFIAKVTKRSFFKSRSSKKKEWLQFNKIKEKPYAR